MQVLLNGRVYQPGEKIAAEDLGRLHFDWPALPGRYYCTAVLRMDPPEEFLAESWIVDRRPGLPGKVLEAPERGWPFLGRIRVVLYLQPEDNEPIWPCPGLRTSLMPVTTRTIFEYQELYSVDLQSVPEADLKRRLS